MQVGYDMVKTFKWLVAAPPPLEVKEPALGCEMPLTKRASCAECKAFGPRIACPLGHMRICGAPIFLSCKEGDGTGCDRSLCWEHIPDEKRKLKCYCKSELVGIGGAAERASARKREIAREREEREREREWC